MKRPMLLIAAVVMIAVGVTHQNCAKVIFSADEPVVDHGFDTLLGRFDFETSYNQGKVWVVTSPGTHTVTEISLDAANSYPTKTWNYTTAGDGGGGSRTFVTAIGLVFARFPARLFFVNDDVLTTPDVPTTPTLTPVWSGTNATPGYRACATSYELEVNGTTTPYVGVAWTSDIKQTDESIKRMRVFTQIPVNIDTKSLEVSHALDTVLGPDNSASWAYGCFTDQGTKTFWASMHGVSGNSTIYGVNLKTLANVTEDPPNANQKLKIDDDKAPYFGDPAGGSGSYGLAGDGDGNVLVGGTTKMYTFASESKNGITYGSTYTGTTLLAFPSFCASGLDDCAGKVFAFSETGVSGASSIATASLGPMSSLNDGRIVAISRGNTSAVYLIEPVQPGTASYPTDLSQGLRVTSIAQIPGNAYMYTDFTGATLYAQHLDKTYDLTQFLGYNAAQPLKSPSFNWTSQSGGSGEVWTGLTVKARCFNVRTEPTVSKGVVDSIEPSGHDTSLSGAPGCGAPDFDHVEIEVTATGASIFTRASHITVTALQPKL